MVSGGGGGGGRILVEVEESFGFVGTYVVRGGSSKLAQAGASGFAVQNTINSVTNQPETLIFASNEGTVGNNSYAKTLFAETSNADKTYTYTQAYIGENTVLTLQGEDIRLEVKQMSCDSETALVEVPDNTRITVDKGQAESVVDCSFQVSFENLLVMFCSIYISYHSQRNGSAE